MNDRVSISIEDGIADVRLNRADKMNALDPDMFEGIIDAIAALSSNNAVRVVVLSGEGRAFCAGLDFESFRKMGGGNAREPGRLTTRTHGVANRAQQTAWGWRNLPVPVIAAVHGVALGGGLQICLGADIRIVAPDARLSVLEIKWGLVPDLAGLPLMRELARDDVVRELTFTGRQFSGEEAVALGFATRVSTNPHADAMALAREIAGKSPDAIRAAKRLLNKRGDSNEADLLMAESLEQERLIGSPNQLEAVRAGMERRAPNFTEAS